MITISTLVPSETISDCSSVDDEVAFGVVIGVGFGESELLVKIICANPMTSNEAIEIPASTFQETLRGSPGSYMREISTQRS